MSQKTSAGLMMYRRGAGGLDVLLAHPGGPYYRGKDEGAWSIPKGELENGEDPLDAARREFAEETGIRPAGPFEPLGTVTQRGGKTVHAWGVAGELPPGYVLASNECEIEWPPRSGRRLCIPEIDALQFFPAEEARRKINPAQAEFVSRLETFLAASAEREAKG